MDEFELLNFVRDTGIATVVILLGFLFVLRYMAFMDSRAKADELRAQADDNMLVRQMKLNEQHIEISRQHAEFNQGLLKSIADLSQQIIAATATITSFSTATSRSIGGLLEAIADGNNQLTTQFEASLDQKTDMALKTIARVQETADAINTGQTAMQGQLSKLAETIMDVSSQLQTLQTIEDARKSNDEQFRSFLNERLGALAVQLANAESMLNVLQPKEAMT